MRAIVQRVSGATVEVGGRVTGRIGEGLVLYVGVARGDTNVQVRKMADKIAGLRIFSDAEDKLNLSVLDVGGKVLAISNFTVQADASRGRRPAFTDAAPPEEALPLHEAFLAALEERGCPVATGVFGEKMTIRAAAEGPVNILVDIPPG